MSRSKKIGESMIFILFDRNCLQKLHTNEIIKRKTFSLAPLNFWRGINRKGKKKARKVKTSLCRALAEILITGASAVIAEAIIRLLFG